MRRPLARYTSSFLAFNCAIPLTVVSHPRAAGSARARTVWGHTLSTCTSLEPSADELAGGRGRYDHSRGLATLRPVWVYIGESATQAKGTDVSLVDRIVAVTRSRLFSL